MTRSNIFILVLFVNCTSRVYTYQKFTHTEFSSEQNHLAGKSYLSLDDSVYTYVYGKGANYSKGIWKMSKDGKYIIINSQAKWDTNAYVTPGKPIRVYTFKRFVDQPVKIINYKTIDFDNRVFKIVKTSR